MFSGWSWIFLSLTGLLAEVALVSPVARAYIDQAAHSLPAFNNVRRTKREQIVLAREFPSL